jgi:hypothetical protein
MADVSERWYRQPVLWLAAAILLASIAGCIGVILLASRNPDVLLTDGDQLLRVPVKQEPERVP